jgi:endoglucanase Acf2
MFAARIRRVLLAWVSAVAAMAALQAAAFDGEVTVGRGSYSTVLPPGAVNIQSTIYKTANVTGKIQTNDWWSSTAWVQYSERQYPHPLAVQNQANGLRLFYPGPTITGNSACVCGWMPATSDPNGGDDLIIGHTGTSSFIDTRVDGFSDWFVTNVSTNGGSALKVTYGHGSPYVYAEYAGGTPRIVFPAVPAIWSGNANTPVLGVTINGRHYALFGPTGSTWTGIGTNVLVNNLGGRNYFSVAVLPDNSTATLAKFQQYAYSFVTGTQVNWSYEKPTAEVVTTYNYTTVAKQGTQTGTLFALYPHQWKNSSKALLPPTYASVRGVMKLAEGTSFTTRMRFPGVLPALPDLGSYNRTTLANYVNEAAAEVYDGPLDTYWFGKRLGKVATLAPIADQVGDATAGATFRNELRGALQNWLKASNAQGALKPEHVFYYNGNWGTLFGYPDSYGSVLELNDHHFHYGYFIKAAAELARTDKNWASNGEWGGMIRLLIRDIASPDRNDSMFPFLRNFDVYAGHTWASGHANFGDGNNNESSSEAMNAWTGLILFAEAVGDTALRDLGIYLYTTEMNAINEYWFDVSGENHHPNFTRSTASMVWGGKTVGDGVWWTGNPEEVHGINWLPIQAGSLYLTQFPDYTRRNYEALVAENGGTNWNEWGDIIWMYRAIHDPADAINQMNSGIGSLFIERGNSRANTYHWVHNIDALGTTDRAVTANHPLYAVFNKQGRRTYVAYNMSNAPITVAFSDGTAINVSANSFSSGNGTDSDTQPPTPPTGLTSPGKSSSSVSLAWNASTDNVGVAGYRIYRGGANVGTSSGTTFTDTGLSAGTSYTYMVRAFDAAGNESGASNSVTVTTDNPSGGGHGHTISGSNVHFYANNAPWADVHYVINGGAQQNLRMTHSGANNTYQLSNVPPGATVTYRFTIGLAAGGATETAWITFTMGGGSVGHGHTISGSNVNFYVNNAPWADLHYTIDDGVQLNVRMTPAGGNNTYTVSNVPGGAVVRYRFTIGLAAGGATESAWTTFTK